MSILIRILGTILITLAFIVCLLAFIYVISIELYELLEVDVLWRVKRKVQRLIYEQEPSKNIARKLFRIRNHHDKRFRKTTSSIARRLREKEFEQKAIQEKDERSRSGNKINKNS